MTAPGRRPTLWVEDIKDPSLNWSCCFSEYQTDPMCMTDAVWHGFKIEDGEILAMTVCCDTHKPIMQGCVDWVHAIDTPCGLPESRFKWPENFCYMPAGEFGVVEAAQGVMQP